MENNSKPSREEAEEAVRTLLCFIGEDPQREGLRETPKRVINSYLSMFKGYEQDCSYILSKTFSDVEGFGDVTEENDSSSSNDIVLLKNIDFSSCCEHHWLPIIGTIDIAYIPSGKVIGVSKLARLVDVFSQRLQIQERLTVQIANTLQKHFNPSGVAIRVSALHYCMSMRGVFKKQSTMDSFHYTGILKEAKYQKKFLLMLGK